MNKSLEELRKKWEGSSIYTWEFPIDNAMIFVLSKYHNSYQLLRYFTTADSWSVSCDETSKNVDNCLDKMSKIMKTL